MSSQVTEIRVFVASPGDVEAERQALATVVQDVNLALTALTWGSAIVELVPWETYVHPDLGRAQAVINEQIGDYDILVGMMWRRFGTPSGVAASGTEEEVRAAYARWKRTGSPRVMFYFSLAEAPPLASTGEVEQMGRVLAFRQELAEKGLVKFYAGVREFPDIIRRDLILLVGRMIQASPAPAEAAVRLAQLPQPRGGDDLDRRITELAADYNQIRRDMSSGDPRTRRMEIIASRMRALAGELYSSLPSLSDADDPGQRLAAVTFLQAIPHPDYLRWLADRFGPDRETPFVEYHAGVALLAAARVLAVTHRDELRRAVQRARDLATDLSPRTDRYQVLREAAEVLEMTPTR